MTYFTKAGWEHGWITTAEDLAKTEWAANYNIVAAMSEPQSGITEAGKSSNHGNTLMFSRTKSAPIDTLKEWISSPIITTSLNPIAYWTSMDVAGHKLAQMALDYLLIPVLGSWGSLEGAIPQEEIVQVFWNKRKQQKKKQKLAEKSSDIEIGDEF
ncbi:hypothetical protein B0H34DRAFT_845681 [Crassisporium funariophilum]|nr:hypothetical protein B0H34DRAFT_845681 [Crassisporium funariophilum]